MWPQTLRQAVPLGCETGFEKAGRVYSTACGVTVYGPYITQQGHTWSPPQQHNTIECLGPEVCPPFPCFEKGSNRKLKGADWYEEYKFAARGGKPFAGNDKDYIELSKEECDNPNSEWPGQFFLCELACLFSAVCRAHDVSVRTDGRTDFFVPLLSQITSQVHAIFASSYSFLCIIVFICRYQISQGG